jgi:hypothetical protein
MGGVIGKFLGYGALRYFESWSGDDIEFTMNGCRARLAMVWPNKNPPALLELPADRPETAAPPGWLIGGGLSTRPMK